MKNHPIATALSLAQKDSVVNSTGALLTVAFCMNSWRGIQHREMKVLALSFLIAQTTSMALVFQCVAPVSGFPLFGSFMVIWRHYLSPIQPNMNSRTEPVSPAHLDLGPFIRAIPDYPRPGILFRDLTPLFGDARAFSQTIEALAQPWKDTKVDRVAGIEARGFILGSALAYRLSAGFIPIRKKGKLPHTTLSATYALEYGSDQMEIHQDALSAGERIVLVDDLIATGGTAEAAVTLLRELNANLLGACFVIDLVSLGGSAKLKGRDVNVSTLFTFRK